jgi:hypothetical protein
VSEDEIEMYGGQDFEVEAIEESAQHFGLLFDLARRALDAVAFRHHRVVIEDTVKARLLTPREPSAEARRWIDEAGVEVVLPIAGFATDSPFARLVVTAQCRPQAEHHRHVRKGLA